MIEWINEITPLLALWGVVLSTILGIIKINNLRRRITVKTKIFRVIHEKYKPGYPNYFKIRLKIQGVNNGKRPIEIVGCGLVIDNFGPISFEKPAEEVKELPKTINDGKSVRISINVEKLLGILLEENKLDTKSVRGYIIDGNDKEYFGNSVNFNAKDSLIFYPSLFEKYNDIL